MSRLLLFDIDGTLIRTRKGLMQKIVTDSLASAGYSLTEGALNQSFSGRTDTDIFHSLSHSLPADLAPLSLHYCQHLQNNIRPEDVELLPEVDSTLSYFKESPYRLSLLTGNFEQAARIKLQQVAIDHFFEWHLGAFGADGAQRDQLPPKALQRARIDQQLKNLKADEVWVIGDTPNDIACAKAHNMVSVAVSTGYFSAKELAKHEPDYLLENLSPLKQLLKT